MELNEWIENHLHFLDNKQISLPIDIKKSNLTFEEIKPWILYNNEAEDYYHFFPFFKLNLENEIIMFYININEASPDYQQITCLKNDFSAYWLNKNFLSWNKFKEINTDVYNKMIQVNT